MLVIDNFAGGGGASTGIEQALGFSPQVAINHNPVALAMHEANHPLTDHMVEDVWNVSPLDVAGGKEIGFAWFSPDCRHFSRAKGGKPVSKSVRGLANIVHKYARINPPIAFALENVPEFLTWGPLQKDGRPNKKKAGQSFRRWLRGLQRFGYVVEWRVMRACDYGAPTTRKRLYIFGRRDGKPIVWPAPTHGPGLLPYRTAASCIDFTIPCPSIFERKKPLVEKTLARIAKGIERHVINNPKPFIVKMRRHSTTSSIDEPLDTITAGGTHFGLAAPVLIQTGYGERPGQRPRFLDINEPIGAVVAGGAKHALVAAFLERNYGGNARPIGASLEDPMPTITARDHHALVVALMVSFYGSTEGGQSVEGPMPTVTTRDRFGLVEVEIDGLTYRIVDIGFRMLTPRELFRAQGFPDTYDILETTISREAQIHMCGNSVCPTMARAIVAANLLDDVDLAVMPNNPEQQPLFS